MSRELRRTLFGVVVMALVIYSSAVIFTRAPIERVMGEAQKIFYYHVGSAWTMFVALTITAVGGVAYLVRKSPRADAVAGASAELGFLYATIVLLTGSIWGRSAWNTWWNWEPRLTSMLVLWLIYAAYLVLRSSTSGEARRRNASVFGIVAFVMSPIVYFSINLWGSLLHPPTRTVRELDPAIFRVMGLGALTMLAMYLYLLSLRTGLENVETEVESLRRRVVR
jgi:heme exporter protein C